MLRKIRIVTALFFFAAITLLFLDFSGTLHAWLGWMAKVQFLPALLALNVGVVVALIVLTLLFGRVYCSVVCPLGVMQDAVSWVAGKRKKFRFTPSPALNWLRYVLLVLFVVALVAHIGFLAALLEPYSAYGRIVSNLVAPLWQWVNNLLAWGAERIDSYAFYTVDVWLRSGMTLAVAAATLVVLAVLSWRNGRTWCNTVCPVGTVLGFVSRFSLWKPRIDTAKCNGCKLCARNCKASCIDPVAHRIDYSRCVACMDCLGSCRQGAIVFSRRGAGVCGAEHTEGPKTGAESGVTDAASAADSQSAAADRPRTDSAAGSTAAPDPSRRRFLGLVGLFAYTAAHAQQKKLDGGLALIEDKKIPNRSTPITPAGSESARHFTTHCTACQLCVSVCPNNVLRPSGDLETFMKPEMSYERGYCRPECTKCGEVCPAGAIRRVDQAEKSSIQIGHAVWVRQNCVVMTDGVKCDNCQRHCPVGAIHMVSTVPGDSASLQIPAVDQERCIGCGACENLCPARPFSAIYVEGHTRHRTV